MSDISPLTEITNLKSLASWMQNVIKAYESGAINKKTVAALAKRTLKKFNNYIAKPEERENYGKLSDLCTSLSTIQRSEGNFEKFYLGSLKEELDILLKTLMGV
ncbi:MAG: hypothetical protein ACTSQ4_03395 [Candidatus Heimdallarchaeaceae archaeon]